MQQQDSPEGTSRQRIGAAFAVTPSDSRRLIALFHEAMRLGLAGHPGPLGMFPSFVSRPQGSERGRFLAIDLGGMNLRVLSVQLDGNGSARVDASLRVNVPDAVMRGTGEALFDFIAHTVRRFQDEHDQAASCVDDLAFTFSFPVVQTSAVSGRLLAWTKGFSATGVAGKDPAVLLAGALRRVGMKQSRVAALTNDAVATLAAACYADPRCDMAVILGTGTNACYIERVDRIAAVDGRHPARDMIVNLEWGNFDQLAPTEFDAALDRASSNPGRQRLEKMVSGRYLGELARRVILDAQERGDILAGVDTAALKRDYVLSAELMALTARGAGVFNRFGIGGVTGQDQFLTAEICRVIMRRAARIAGSAIAAVITWMDPDLQGEHGVAVDGALFLGYPGFREAVEDLLRELFGDRAAAIALVPTRDGSGVGAAVVAAAVAATAGSGQFS